MTNDIETRTVVIFEDERDDVQKLTEVFRGWKTIVYSSEEEWNKVNIHIPNIVDANPDLIIVDIYRYPKRDLSHREDAGWRIVKQLKRAKDLKHVPVLVFSVIFRSDEDATTAENRAKKSGVPYLTKPKDSFPPVDVFLDRAGVT